MIALCRYSIAARAPTLLSFRTFAFAPAQTSPAQIRFTIDAPRVDFYLKQHGGGTELVGTLEQLLCGVGARFYVDEEVAVIETDKVALSVHARQGGIVTRVLVKVGEEVKEGQPIYEAVRSVDKPDKTDYEEAKDRWWLREHKRRTLEEEAAECEDLRRNIEAWLRKLEKEHRGRQEHHRQRHRQWRRQRRARNTYTSSSSSRSSQGPWAILGLEPGASKAEIKAAFRKVAFEYHPDRNASPKAVHHADTR
jgi:pyruvate/2-oxoglutarate dehydrogenase complex dihydrolipoamide acyltransferase (E2) component